MVSFFNMVVGVNYTHSYGKGQIKEYHLIHWMLLADHGANAMTAKQWIKKLVTDLKMNMGIGSDQSKPYNNNISPLTILSYQ